MRSVCVFCGSNPGRRPEYLAGAADLGRTLASRGIRAKPTGLLNLLGYYDGLLRFLDHATQERFVRPDHREMILASPSAAELLAVMDGWAAPRAPAKWIDADGSDIDPRLQAR